MKSKKELDLKFKKLKSQIVRFRYCLEYNKTSSSKSKKQVIKIKKELEAK